MGIILSHWHVQEPRNTKSSKREQVALMPAGLECNFLNISISLKHACAEVEIIWSIEKRVWVHRWWQGSHKHSPVGSEAEHFKYFHVNNKTIVRWWAEYIRLSYPDAIRTSIHLTPLFWLSAHQATFWLYFMHVCLLEERALRIYTLNIAYPYHSDFLCKIKMGFWLWFGSLCALPQGGYPTNVTILVYISISSHCKLINKNPNFA